MQALSEMYNRTIEVYKYSLGKVRYRAENAFEMCYTWELDLYM
jgi:hypothetical protein